MAIPPPTRSPTSGFDAFPSSAQARRNSCWSGFRFSSAQNFKFANKFFCVAIHTQTLHFRLSLPSLLGWRMDENLTRAAEFHVEALFKDPPAAKEDCPICFTNASTMVMLSFTSTHNYIVCTNQRSGLWNTNLHFHP